MIQVSSDRVRDIFVGNKDSFLNDFFAMLSSKCYLNIQSVFYLLFNF